jgi:DNA-3-methyladenine glycosylase
MMNWLEQAAHEVAPRLLGSELHIAVHNPDALAHRLPTGVYRVRILETEAYEETDAASHSFNGRKTARNAAMFGPPGMAYVYQIYGLYHCFNISCGPEGSGQAVLIRSVSFCEPVPLQSSVGTPTTQRVNPWACDGPGKLCRVFGISRATHDSVPLHTESLAAESLFLPGAMALCEAPPLPIEAIRITPRIGLTRAIETPWRFVWSPLSKGH